MGEKFIHTAKFILAFWICLCMLLGGVPVAYAGIGDTITNETELRNAISSAVSGDTLPPLGASFSTAEGIAISGKDITIDLSGYTLTIHDDADAGLTLANSILAITGAGELNVEGATYGLMIESGGKATVTNALVTGDSHEAVHVQNGGKAYILGNVLASSNSKGIVAVSTDTEVTVGGDVTAGDIAVTARNGAAVNISGKVESSNKALMAADSGSIHVSGNVSSGTMTGISAASGGQIDVDGSVTGVSDGVYASGGDTDVDVSGVVQATAADGTGAAAYSGAKITLHNNVFGGKYGIVSSSTGSNVYVYQNVAATGTDSIGAYACDGGEVLVLGNTAGKLYGGAAAAGGLAIITGNCTATDIVNGVGAYAYNGNAQIVVCGALTGETYIKVGSTPKDPSDHTVPTTRLGFITYDDADGNTVWRKDGMAGIATAPGSLPSLGGTSQITITGNDLPDGIVVTAFLGDTETAVTGTTAGSETEQTATLTFPTNTSTVDDQVYTLKARIGTTGWMAQTISVTVAKADAAPPIVVTNPVTNITTTGAMFSGNVTSDSGSTVTVRGFVCGVSANPSIEDFFLQANLGSGTGSFNTTISNKFAAGTSYHVRAYAINDQGVAYGEDVSFTTSSNSGGGGGGGGHSSSGTSTQTYNAVLKEKGTQAGVLSVTVDSASKNVKVSLTTSKAEELFSKGVVITMPSIPGMIAYTLELPAASLTDTQGTGTLTLATGVGSISIPNNMLSTLSGTEGKKAGINIGQGDKTGLTNEEKAAIGDRPLIQLTLTLDGVRTEWNNPNAPVTVSIPYIPKAEELKNPENIIIWYLDGSGNAVCIPNGHYDSATGTVTFAVTHFSQYAVGYNEVSFNDVVSRAWYGKAVCFIAARGITTGTGNGNFSPEAKLTRGEFIVMLMKAYGMDPDLNPKDNFADAGSTYYTGYLAAAKRLGISNGVGSNMFA
ncbi:MAG: S-layer homology domain-containing protein, partial [Smithella sp.]